MLHKVGNKEGLLKVGNKEGCFKVGNKEGVFQGRKCFRLEKVGSASR